MKKTTPIEAVDYYFIPKENDYGITEYICVIKWNGIYFMNGPRHKNNWCFDLGIISSEFDTKVKPI